MTIICLLLVVAAAMMTIGPIESPRGQAIQRSFGIRAPQTLVVETVK